ncbi:FAD-dependent oxidoreductase [Nocardioides cheoyonin]|uniref:FAD-dependent oxidoreductase n=1 Tax=Nocardioides cheoyonin TaxID=3156615 RepID=UPI0032B581AA
MSTYYQPRRHEPTPLDSTPDGTSLPVVVVGAGPIGMATALGLAKRGIEVTVIEAATSVSYGSRAICISRHSQEVADRLGFGEALAQRALAWEGGRSFYRDQEVLRFRMPNEAHCLRPPMVNISQSEYEEIVLDAVAASPLVTVAWGVELTGLTADDAGVTLTVGTVDGKRTLRADRVVAADGGRSRTRELMGLRLEGTAYEGRYVIADIHWESGLPTERMVWFDPPSNPGSTVIMHQQPDDIWRIDYQLSPEEDVESETTEEAIRARIAKHLAWLEDNGTITAGPWTLEWQGFYKALALALPDFVPASGHGRVAFAGDAAHLVPIFGVRGLNSGLEDADTLAWMLAAVAHGDAEESLLQAYARERHDAWEQNIAAAGKSTLVMTPGTDGYRTTRDALLELAAVKPEFSHLIDPRQSSATHARRSTLSVGGGFETVPSGTSSTTVGTVPSGTSSTTVGTVPSGTSSTTVRPGDPLEDRRLAVDGKQTSLHELRGTGFGVYAVGPLAPEDAAAVGVVRGGLADALPHEQVSTIVLEAGADGGSAAAWQAAPGEVVVVRPDGLVLARGRATDLARTVGELAVRVRTGGVSTGSTAADPVTLTPEQEAREQVWLALSEALDGTEDPKGLLARLALVLGAEAGPRRLRQILAEIGPGVRPEIG